MFKLILLILLIYQISSAKLIIDNDQMYETIPLPMDGWTNKQTIENALCLMEPTEDMEDKIVLFTFDHTKNEVEGFVRQLQNKHKPKAIILKALKYGGVNLFRTDGRRETQDIVTPILDLKDTYFDALKSKKSFNCSLTFEEENYYYVNMKSVTFNLFLSLFTVVSSINFLYSIYVYWLMRNLEFDNRKIGLILEGVASGLRIVASLDLNGTRLLYNFRFARTLITLSLPFSIGSIALFILYSTYLINQQVKKQMTKPFTAVKWLKYVFAGILVFLILIEFVTLILVMTVYEIYEKMVSFTYTIYIILFFLSAILYLGILYIMIRIIRIRISKALEGLNDKKKKNADLFLKRFIYRFVYGFGCIILLSVSFLTNLSYSSIKDSYTRVMFMHYNPLICFYALAMLSIGNVVFYHQSLNAAKNKMIKSSTDSTKIDIASASTPSVADE